MDWRIKGAKKSGSYWRTKLDNKSATFNMYKMYSLQEDSYTGATNKKFARNVPLSKKHCKQIMHSEEDLPEAFSYMLSSSAEVVFYEKWPRNDLALH